jgi:hypothetical protein
MQTPSGVSYSTALPLRWEAGPVSELLRQQSAHANIALLRALATIEAMPTDREIDPGPTTKALDRLEAKVDLTLNLLGRLLSQGTAMPPAVPVKLSANAIEWESATGPKVGDEVALTLFLSQKLPQPLLLCAKVVAVEVRATGVHTRTELLPTGAEMQDWLERTIFRYHRRAIQARDSRDAEE